jgi:chorismate dehydratase
VNSVFIFSQVPVNEIKSVRLDPQSRTSNNLARVLLKFYWKKEVLFTTDPEATTDAIVLIGDRTFGKKSDYPFFYDMGEEWMNFTGLPFLYAAWIANKTIPESFIMKFNQALKSGLEQRETLLNDLPQYANFDVKDYLLHKLDFDLTAKKKEAMLLFLKYIEQL